MGDRKTASECGASGIMRPLEGGRGSRFSDEAMIALATCGELMYNMAREMGWFQSGKFFSKSEIEKEEEGEEEEEEEKQEEEDEEVAVAAGRRCSRVHSTLPLRPLCVCRWQIQLPYKRNRNSVLTTVTYRYAVSRDT